jgi:hypothetical protein
MLADPLAGIRSTLDAGERPPYLLIEGSPAGLGAATCGLYAYGYRPLAALAAIPGDIVYPVRVLQSVVYHPEHDTQRGDQQQERSRIRRELLDWHAGKTDEGFLTVVDRILPEEG